MNYPSMTIRQLREICRMDDKYQGHWSCKTKSHLIDFMSYSDKALEWKTPARQQSQVSDSSNNDEIVTTGTLAEKPTSREPAPVQVGGSDLLTPIYRHKDPQTNPHEKGREFSSKIPHTPPVHSARSVVPALLPPEFAGTFPP